MRTLILLIVFSAIIFVPQSLSEKSKSASDIQRKSQLNEDDNFGPSGSSYPQGFREIGQPADKPAISTGYYFVDSEDIAPGYWRPAATIVDTNTESPTWHRILPGPRILPQNYWDNNPDEGHRFFHNTAAVSGGEIDFFDHDRALQIDSTDNAIAGPIPIGFGFYFNGLRYDSFYVTTNGLIALTNRRYIYDASGNRVVPSGKNNCYDPMSMDWYERNKVTSTGLDDPTEDNFGYLFSVLGNAPGEYLGGIRAKEGALNSLNPNHKAAVITPFWGDNQLSQYNAAKDSVDDWGKCYYKRYENADKLIIYYVNLAPVNTKATPTGNYDAQYDLRPGEDGYISANAQIILDASDSSITLVYERFDGVAIVNNRTQKASTIFRYNTTACVRGFARQVNYGQAGSPTYPWAGEYEQFTHYFHQFENVEADYPGNMLAVKFKQWQNMLRVVRIQYRVRKQEETADLNYSDRVDDTKIDNYELLAGEERIGQIQPVAIVQNLTNNIQGEGGVNYVPQGLNFRVRFRMVNMATERIIYNRLLPVDSTCLALRDSNAVECTGDRDVRVRYVTLRDLNDNLYSSAYDFPGTNNLNGIPPYGFVEVKFPPFLPNEFVENHIGRMKAYAIADPRDPEDGSSLGDEWPFDDTLSSRLFVMNRLIRFNQDVTQFHLVEGVAIPSVLKWVNIGAEVVSGEDVSKHPMPPMDDFAARNNENYVLSTPAIRMNRIRLDGSEPASSPGGDEIRSFPIDMRNQYRAAISFSVQRAEHRDDWPSGWSDRELIGPEPRTILNGNVWQVWNRNRNAASFSPDELVLEFARPSPDGIKYITNIPEDRWRHHPRRGGAPPVTNMPAITVFGAGGYMTGFLESDKDSALSSPVTGRLGGLRPNIYDSGIDDVYKRYFAAIPDTFIRAENEGAKNFRFRVKVNATNDKKCNVCIPDDNDDFFVDNIRLLFYSPEATDIGVTSVKIDWPYTMVPASQATNIPIKVRLSNNTTNDAPSYVISVIIWRKSEYRMWGRWIYCRTGVIASNEGLVEFERSMPSWNARRSGPGEYRIEAIVWVPGGDLEERNDTTYTDVTIRFGDAFAYDPVENPRNDVPDSEFSGISGRGLNLYGYAYGSRGTEFGPTEVYDERTLGSGSASGSGRIASKFELFRTDTIYGFRAFFGTLNQSWDDISLTVYTDAGGQLPGSIIPGSQIYRIRGFDDIREDYFWDEYVTYLYDDDPLILPSGTYWAVIGQLAETGLKLGASKSRMGMRTTNVSIPIPTNVGGPTGGGGTSLMLERNFRKYVGWNLINKNFFAVENGGGSGVWSEFMPNIGNPAYGHLHHFGISPADGQTATLSRGSWIPMIRPYLGERSYETGGYIYYGWGWCVPVELLFFSGDVRSSGINLEWATESEDNNYGFYIERRLHNPAAAESWEAIGFVKGNKNSKVHIDYDYFDNDVQINTTYQYRLRQVDYDGTFDCTSSGVVTLKYSDIQPLTLYPNRPNPFREYTNIAFYLPEESNVVIEISDIYGKFVNRLINQPLPADFHQFVWDGRDNSGTLMPVGTYIYKLNAGGEILSGKMSLVR